MPPAADTEGRQQGRAAARLGSTAQPSVIKRNCRPVLKPIDTNGCQLPGEQDCFQITSLNIAQTLSGMSNGEQEFV